MEPQIKFEAARSNIEEKEENEVDADLQAWYEAPVHDIQVAAVDPEVHAWVEAAAPEEEMWTIKDFERQDVKLTDVIAFQDQKNNELQPTAERKKDMAKRLVVNAEKLRDDAPQSEQESESAERNKEGVSQKVENICGTLKGKAEKLRPQEEEAVRIPVQDLETGSILRVETWLRNQQGAFRCPEKPSCTLAQDSVEPTPDALDGSEVVKSTNLDAILTQEEEKSDKKEETSNGLEDVMLEAFNNIVKLVRGKLCGMLPLEWLTMAKENSEGFRAVAKVVKPLFVESFSAALSGTGLHAENLMYVETLLHQRAADEVDKIVKFAYLSRLPASSSSSAPSRSSGLKAVTKR